MSHKSIKEIFAHNEVWRAEQLAADPNYFVRLSQKQSPKYLFIGCSDSRISTEVVMCSKPGDVFIHRNIANVVPVNDLNITSVINYAVNHLKVKHIVVCGHYGCGGVKNAINKSDVGILNPWLGYIRDVYRLHKKELNAIESPDAKFNRLVELNILEQCINLIKIRDVQKAILERRIQIHGWVFEMCTGKLTNLNFKYRTLAKELQDIYSIL